MRIRSTSINTKFHVEAITNTGTLTFNGHCTAVEEAGTNGDLFIFSAFNPDTKNFATLAVVPKCNVISINYVYPSTVWKDVFREGDDKESTEEKPAGESVESETKPPRRRRPRREKQTLED